MIEENAILSNGTEQSYTKKNYEYDPVGNQLKSVITSSTTPEVVERTYDELGRVKTKSVSNIEGKTIYVYDFITSDGLTAETSIDQKNNITTKVYDAVGRLAFVKNGDINAANIAEYDYYKNGSAKSVIYAGGAREDYTYYPDGRLESLVNKDNKGVAFESYVYTYDVNGNMLSKEDKKGRTSYTYDNLNRLKTVDEEYIGKTTEYIYDKLGNRSNVTIKENGIITEEHTYNYNYDLNQLNSVIMKVDGTVASITYYTYDGNGNQIKTETDGITTIFAYDEFNQLISADGAKYGYNAEGYRVSKNVNGSLTRYIYEYDKVVLEVNAAGNQEGRNIYGTNLIMRTVAGESYYYMYNGHADVTALINAATCNIDATYYYDAFGNITESTGAAKDKNSILYSGYQYDSETGLYYLNARMYDPKVARFLQEDTYTGDPNDPLSLNLYTYCANNPLIYYDPTGHFNVFSREEWKKFASDAKEVVIGIADGTMRYVSGNTYQSVGDFVNDVNWAYNNSEYLASGTVSYVSETASNIKQGTINFANDVKWAYNNRDIVAETINEGVQQFKSDVQWAINNRDIVAQTTSEMATQAINDFNSKSLREKTAFITDVTLNVASFIGAPEAAAAKLTQIRKVDKMAEAINLIDKLYDAGAGMKRLDKALDATNLMDDLYDVGKGMKKLDKVLDSSKLDNWIEPAGSLGAMRNPRLAKYGEPGQRDALLNAVRKTNYIRADGTINKAALQEAKGVVYAQREMKRLGYSLQDVSLHYKGNQGLDLIFSNGTKYAVVEAKHGRYLSLLKKDINKLRQGSLRYNIDRLEKYLDFGDGIHNDLVNQLLLEAYAGNLESFASLYRSERLFELPLGWPRVKAIKK